MLFNSVYQFISYVDLKNEHDTFSVTPDGKQRSCFSPSPGCAHRVMSCSALGSAGPCCFASPLHFSAASEQSSWAEGSRAVSALQYKARGNLALKVEKELCTSTEHSGLGSGENKTKGGEEDQSQTCLPLRNHLKLFGFAWGWTCTHQQAQVIVI